MSVTGLAILLAVAAVGLMAFAWIVAERTGKSGWIDAIWSLGTGALGVAAALVPINAAGAPTLRQWLVAALAAAWSLRLGLHIVARTLKGGDDPRYAALREGWGADARRRLFWFAQAQGGAALLLTLCVGLAARNPANALRLLDVLGFALIVLALAGEGIADRQLGRYRAEPGGRGVCDAGLWSYSRHPNYFFEWLGWLGFALVAIHPGGGYPLGWLAFVGPATMYGLLVHVSGIPPLEAHMLRSRGEVFRAYQRRVSAFWPWPPLQPKSESS